LIDIGPGIYIGIVTDIGTGIVVDIAIGMDIDTDICPGNGIGIRIGFVSGTGILTIIRICNSICTGMILVLILVREWYAYWYCH
jgi:hypothetical protein